MDWVASCGYCRCRHHLVIEQFATPATGSRGPDTRDPVGNLLTAVEAGGSTTTWAYDDDHRLTSETRNGSVGSPASTPMGTIPPTFQPPTVTPSGTVPPITSTPSATPGTPGTPGLIAWQQSYGYDAVSNRTSQTMNGITTTYSYNALDEVVTAGTPNIPTMGAAISSVSPTGQQCLPMPSTPAI